MTAVDLKGRIAVVTGASRGIGFHAAKALAAAGAHIVAVARTVGGLEDLDDDIKAVGGSATLVPVDLKDSEAIDRLGAEINQRWGKLDILLANAGTLGQMSPIGHISPENFDEVIATNLTANWRLIRSLDPLLRQSDAGRALFVSSGAAHSARAFLGAYSASKAALEALAKTYAAEMANTNLRVITIDPGILQTAMRAQAMPGEDPDSLRHPSELAPYIVALASPQFQTNRTHFVFPLKKLLNHFATSGDLYERMPGVDWLEPAGQGSA